MYTILDHNSDVYAISCHPLRPFVFASCSRDTTLRMFSFDGLMSSLKMQVLSSVKLDNDKKQLCDTPEATYQSKGTYKLCSKIAHEKIYKSNTGGYKNEISSLLDWYDFMSFSDG